MTPSTSSTAPLRATSRSAFPTWPTSFRKRGGDHGYARKSGRRHRRRRRIGLDLRRGAGQGRQEGRGDRGGAGLAAHRPHQLGYLGTADQAGRRAVPARRKESLRLRLPGPLGRRPRCFASLRQLPVAFHAFSIFPWLFPLAFKIKSERGRELDWPINYSVVAPFSDKVAADIGMSGDARAEEIWRPAGAPYPMPPMKTFRHGEIWLKG